MDSSIRGTLWSAFAVLVVLIIAGVALTIGILHLSDRQESRIVEGSTPLLDAIYAMNDDTLMIMSAARGYALTRQTQFLQQYDEAIRDFRKAAANASQLATDPHDAQIVASMRKNFNEVKLLTDQEVTALREDRDANANEYMVEASKVYRAAPDYAGTMADEHQREERHDLARIGSMRTSLTLLMVIVSAVIIVLAAYLIWRIQQSLIASINRQVKRTETMIGGMSDGVMLVDDEGKTAYLNRAAKNLLGRADVGVPIFQHAEVYGLLNDAGEPVEASELPATRALSTGRPVRDITMMVSREERQIAISVSATPLRRSATSPSAGGSRRPCNCRPGGHRSWPTPEPSSPATSIRSGSRRPSPSASPRCWATGRRSS